MKLKAYTFLQVLIICLTNICYSQSVNRITSTDEKIYLDLFFAETSELQYTYVEDTTINLNLTKYNYEIVPSTKDSSIKIYIFKSFFGIDNNLKNNDLALFFGTSNLPCDVYLNKIKIGRVGSYKEIYTSQIHSSKSFYLPTDLLYYGTDSINELCFQFYPKYHETRPMDKMFISSYQKISSYTFWRTFVGLNLVHASIVFALILFIYFIFGYILKKDKSDFKYLLFALFCLSYSFSYTNVAFIHDTISQLNLLKLSRVGLAVSNLLMIYLSMSFTQFLNKKKILKLLLGIPTIFFVILILIQKNVVELDATFTFFVTLINIPYMFFAFVLAIIGTIKRKTIHNLFYIIGFTFLLLAVIHDSLFFSLLLTPYAWVIPNGYSVYITFIFFILASEQVKIYKLSVMRASELQKMKDHLEELVKERTAEIEHQKEEIGSQRDNLQNLNQNLNKTITELNQKNIEIEQQKEEIGSQRDYLKDLNENLSVINNQLHQKNEEISSQKEEIELKNKNITASINYAKRIQNAILPPTKILENYFAEHFIFYQPKNIVSGDFYFVRNINNYLIIAAADCTGHGVPGAFMSMLGITLLNEIVTKKDVTTAAETLNALRYYLKSSLQHKGLRIEQRDGIDIALCALNTKTYEMQFAGAQNPLILLKNDNNKEICEFRIIKGDRMPIGSHPRENQLFTNHTFKLKTGDILYMFSDGYESQFGGTNNEKFKAHRFYNLLETYSNLPMIEQRNKLESTFNEWIGNKIQVDDILVMGFKL